MYWFLLNRILLLSSAGLKERTFAELPELSVSSICVCEMSTNAISPKIPIIKVEPGEQSKQQPGNIYLMCPFIAEYTFYWYDYLFTFIDV